jgi:rod shape determining protein RodA
MSARPGVLSRFSVDLGFLSWMLVLCAVGLLVLYSASGQDLETVFRQGARMGLGLCLMLAIAQLPPAYFVRWTPIFYGFGLLFLLAVDLVGIGKGAQRWLDLGVMRFQPSELMKLFVPMMVAWYLNDKRMPPRLRQIAAAGALIVVPVVLVMLQPDLGTAILIALAGVSVLFFAGMSWRLIGATLAGFLASAPLMWSMMHDYQRQRILTLLDPERDPLGTGYHIIQSKIAVGSGGLFGKGWLHGTQSRLDFLPERSTDFIFAVFCEEFGFAGVLGLLAIYLFIIYRGFQIALAAQGTYARLLAGSLTYTLFIYVFVNMGMVTGQLPVVGIPLPFISYGGTSLVTIMVSFGILISFHTHRNLLAN